MKVVVITDTHWGVRNDAVVFHDYFKKFLDNVFFPYLDEHDIKEVVHLGDLVDRRKYINYLTLHRLKSDFLSPLFSRDVSLTVLLGNHDIAYKNTNEINALDELFSEFSNRMHVIRNAEHVALGDTEVLMIPWINQENEEHSMNLIKRTNAQIAMGHLELAGFEQERGSVALHGQSATVFDKFDIVLSGHYHHKSTNGTVFYLGAPYQMTWSDYDDPKGFHVFDTETRELEFIENPFIMFEKFFYDDTDLTSSEIVDLDLSKYKNTYVKIVVQVKNNPYIFDTIIGKFEEAGVFDLKIVDDHLNLHLEDDSDIVDEAEDTPTMLKKTIEALKTPFRNRLTSYTQTLYNEALSME